MVRYLVFCAFIAAGYIVYSTFPVKHGPGITAKEEPVISRLTWQEPFSFKGATFTPKKLIKGEVRVVKRKRYLFDAMSKYAPVDILAGWNQLSDQRNLDYIFFNLDNRDYDIELSRPPLDLNVIYGETALWHLIPSTSEIDEKLKNLRNGHIIKIDGLLVDLSDDTSFDYKTSTSISNTRNTRGFAIWVEGLQVR